jgi:16S rRNA (guanine966-N2)-methyltransferase
MNRIQLRLNHQIGARFSFDEPGESSVSRIIAGVAKGKTLRVPKGVATRPTTDRVREAVFSTLAAWASRDAGTGPATAQLESLAFLDLYAGSGAMGLEAASRGAARVTLVENNPVAAALIKDNAASISLQAGVVVAGVERFLSARTPEPFDIVFLDPPYEIPSETVAKVVGTLVTKGWLAAGGVIVVERSGRSAEPQWPGRLRVHDVKRYGETSVFFLEVGVGRVTQTKGEMGDE